MNIISMMHEVHLVADPMISESSLPHLALPANDSAKFMRVRAFDQLDGPLDSYVVRRSQQQMNVFWHDDKRVQFKAPLSAIPIDRVQEDSHVRFDNEQPPTSPCGESDEIGSRRGDESSRLQERTSAAESRISTLTLNWHEWNSCPSRWFLCTRDFILGTAE